MSIDRGLCVRVCHCMCVCDVGGVENLNLDQASTRGGKVKAFSRDKTLLQVFCSASVSVCLFIVWVGFVAERCGACSAGVCRPRPRFPGLISLTFFACFFRRRGKWNKVSTLLVHAQKSGRRAELACGGTVGKFEGRFFLVLSYKRESSVTPASCCQCRCKGCE